MLNEGISFASKAVNDVGIVKELERDVVDLQRNVLIFKENASKSAITRFSRLMVTINAKLDKLAQVDETGELQDGNYILTRMKEHLNAYQQNFTQVVDARSERDNLVARGTLSDITALEGNPERRPNPRKSVTCNGRRGKNNTGSSRKCHVEIYNEA